MMAEFDEFDAKAFEISMAREAFKGGVDKFGLPYGDRAAALVYMERAKEIDPSVSYDAFETNSE